MALLLFGKSTCPLCGRIINEGDAVYSLPPFVVNELDPCFPYTDSAFHETCLRVYRYGSEVLRRVDEWYSKVGPGHRECAVCKTEITDPDDYLLIEYLSDHEDDPLHSFNYTHLHKSCIPRWQSRPYFIELARKIQESDSWKGPYLGWLINEIEAAKNK